ncbi:MAG: hypothetical protein LBP89_05605 [Helicobacteraceae bacterium]|jgi:hypothetical protein|nr:hypothetical protein [Helicobacteraceae bacterium]
MGKSKLSEIAETDEALKGAALKAATAEPQEEKYKSYTVYRIPESWVKAIKSDGLQVATFARLAIIEKLRREGKI